MGSLPSASMRSGIRRGRPPRPTNRRGEAQSDLRRPRTPRADLTSGARLSWRAHARLSFVLRVRLFHAAFLEPQLLVLLFHLRLPELQWTQEPGETRLHHPWKIALQLSLEARSQGRQHLLQAPESLLTSRDAVLSDMAGGSSAMPEAVFVASGGVDGGSSAKCLAAVLSVSALGVQSPRCTLDKPEVP